MSASISLDKSIVLMLSFVAEADLILSRSTPDVYEIISWWHTIFFDPTISIKSVNRPSSRNFWKPWVYLAIVRLKSFKAFLVSNSHHGHLIVCYLHVDGSSQSLVATWGPMPPALPRDHHHKFILYVLALVRMMFSLFIYFQLACSSSPTHKHQWHTNGHCRRALLELLAHQLKEPAQSNQHKLYSLTLPQVLRATGGKSPLIIYLRQPTC